jgi:hypothetical protein
MNNQVTFIHNVYFWLKSDVTDEQVVAFEGGLAKLGTCPTILTYYYGKPAGTPRTVVDNSYNYALSIHFSNAADQDAYQIEPIHEEFIEQYKELWTRVQVYDTILM